MSSEKLSKLQGHEYNHADCILEGQLYLGNETSSRDRKLQQELGITHILSVLNRSVWTQKHFYFLFTFSDCFDNYGCLRKLLIIQSIPLLLLQAH